MKRKEISGYQGIPFFSLSSSLSRFLFFPGVCFSCDSWFNPRSFMEILINGRKTHVKEVGDLWGCRCRMRRRWWRHKLYSSKLNFLQSFSFDGQKVQCNFFHVHHRLSREIELWREREREKRKRSGKTSAANFFVLQMNEECKNIEILILIPRKVRRQSFSQSVLCQTFAVIFAPKTSWSPFSFPWILPPSALLVNFMRKVMPTDCCLCLITDRIIVLPPHLHEVHLGKTDRDREGDTQIKFVGGLPNDAYQ